MNTPPVTDRDVVGAGDLISAHLDSEVQFDHAPHGPNDYGIVYRVNGQLRRVHHEPGDRTVIELAGPGGDLVEFVLSTDAEVTVNPSNDESIRGDE